MTGTDRARSALGMAPSESKELSPLDKRIAATRTMLPALNDALVTSSGVKPETLIRDAITALRSNPQLAECEQQTFFGALMTAAQLGLRPNVPTLGHGWIIPRWNGRARRLEANWQIGYLGMVELGYRSGLVSKISAGTIYEGDTWRIRRGTDDVLEHEPTADVEKRGHPVWHYAIVWLRTGGVAWEALTEPDVQAIMTRFAPKDRESNRVVGPWVSDYLAMARKTALRQLWRYMPKTEALSLALTTDGITRHAEQEPDGRTTIIDVGEAAESEPDAPSAPAQPDTHDEPGSPASEPQGAAEPRAVDFDVDVPVDRGEDGPFECEDGSVREPLGLTAARKAYAQRIVDVHSPRRRVRATIEQVVGQWVPPQYLTTSELRDVAAYRWGDEDVPQS